MSERIRFRFLLRNEQDQYVTRKGQASRLTVTSNRELAYVFNNEDQSILDVQVHQENLLEQDLTPIDWQTGDILDETDETITDDYDRGYGPKVSYMFRR